MKCTRVLITALVTSLGALAQPSKIHPRGTSLERRSDDTSVPYQSPIPIAPETNGVLTDAQQCLVTIGSDGTPHGVKPGICPVYIGAGLENWYPPSNTIASTSTAFDSEDQCSVYVAQYGYGPAVNYQAWVRDASNAAIGNMPTTRIAESGASFLAGGLMMKITADDQGPSLPATVIFQWGQEGWSTFDKDICASSSSPYVTIGNGTEAEGGYGFITLLRCTFGCSSNNE